MKNAEFENLTKQSFSNDFIFLEEMAPANGDSITLPELRQLNMQLRELNGQIGDFRNDLAALSHLRQSSWILGVIGATATTGGSLWLANQGKYVSHVGPYVVIGAGCALCISSVITWICSYTSLANSKVKVTANGVVVKL